MRAVSPSGAPTIFCARCRGARTGQTGGLSASCLLMRDGASKIRLKRLGKGLHPHRAYPHHIRVLGPVVSWAALEAGVDGGDGQVGLPGEGNVAVAHELVQVLGQATVPQALHILQVCETCDDEGGLVIQHAEECEEDAAEEDPSACEVA